MTTDAPTFENEILFGTLTGTPAKIGKKMAEYLESNDRLPGGQVIEKIFQYLKLHGKEIPIEYIDRSFDEVLRKGNWVEYQWAIGGFGGISFNATPVVLELLKHGKPDQREYAARIAKALAKKQIPRVTEALLYALEHAKIELNARNSTYESLVIDGLMECEGIGLRLLELILNDGDVSRRAADATKRYAMTKYATPEVIGFMRRCAETNDGVLIAAYDALVSVGKDPLKNLIEKLRNGGKYEKLTFSRSGFSKEVKALAMDDTGFATLEVVEALSKSGMHIDEKYLEEIASLLAFENPAKSNAIVTFANHASQVGKIACEIIKRSKNERFIAIARLAYEKDETYAVELGLAKVRELLRSYDGIIKTGYTNETAERMRNQMTEFYVHVSKRIRNDKKDAPTRDSELTTLAKYRMLHREMDREEGKPRTFRMQRAIA
ncbi:MAG: hypothetical protein WCT31_03480 [Candidatus Micrarchaeia archaeon]|jgi:hypothetical protein